MCVVCMYVCMCMYVCVCVCVCVGGGGGGGGGGGEVCLHDTESYTSRHLRIYYEHSNWSMDKDYTINQE